MNFKKYSFWMAVVCFLSTGIVSCNKDKADSSSAVLDGTTLNVRVSGIAESNATGTEISTKMGTKPKAAGSGTQKPMTPKLISSENFDVLIDIQPSMEMVHSGGNGLKASTGSGLRAASSPIAADTKYRLLLYKASDNTLVSSSEATAGPGPVVNVEAGQSYKWYAISTNESTAPNVDGAGNIAAASIANKDVLYASGTFVAVAGQNNLDIMFKRHTTRIAVVLDARGLFGTVNGTTSVELGTGAEFSSFLKSGDLNVLTGEYSNLQPVAAVSGDAMQDKTDKGGAPGATKVTYFYSVAPTTLAANSLRVRLNKLDLTLDDDASMRQFVGVMLGTGNAEINAALGNTHAVNLRLIEPPVAVKNMLWARTNLFYQENAPDQYKFHTSNDKNPNVDVDYWRSLSDKPKVGGTSVVVADPCKKVYPLGMWRMPTSAEFTILGTPDSYTTSAFTKRTAVWNTSSVANPAYPATSQDLKLPYFGYKDAGNIQASGSNGPIATIVTAHAEYWTSNINPGPAGAGSPLYQSIMNSYSNPSNPVSVNMPTPAGITQDYWKQVYQKSFLGEKQFPPAVVSEDVTSSVNGGRNIRCVRSSSTPNN